MGISHPLSARKTREAARAALQAADSHAAVLDGLIEKHNSLVRDTDKALQQLTDAINAQKRAFFGRGFVGRLKFLFLGQ